MAALPRKQAEGPDLASGRRHVEELALVLFIGLAKWYPPLYDFGACGYATCAEFLRSAPSYRTPGTEDWDFPGPVCQLRCIDPGIAVGSAAKVASLRSTNTRCQTRIAAAARHLGSIKAGLAVTLSMSVSHKNLPFDKKIPEDKFDEPVASELVS